MPSHNNSNTPGVPEGPHSHTFHATPTDTAHSGMSSTSLPRTALLVPFLLEGSVLFRVSADLLTKNAPDSKLLDWALQYAEWMTHHRQQEHQQELLSLPPGRDVLLASSACSASHWEATNLRAQWASFARRAANLRHQTRHAPNPRDGHSTSATTSSEAVQLVSVGLFMGSNRSHVLAVGAASTRAQRKRGRGDSTLFGIAELGGCTSPPLGSITTDGDGALPSNSTNDADAAIFVDRNAELFGLLVRLLQGYRHCIPLSRVKECREEAYWYGLQRTWDAQFPPAPNYAFYGGGHTVAGDRLTSYVVVSRISPFVPRHAGRQRNEHGLGTSTSMRGTNTTFSVRVQVELSDAVAIGVVSPLVLDYGADSRGIEGTAWYSSGGDIACCPFATPLRREKRVTALASTAADPHHDGDDVLAAAVSPAVLSPTATPLPPCTHSKAPSYGTHSIVTISMDMERGLVWWERNQDVVATVRLWPGSLAGSDDEDVDDDEKDEHRYHQLAFAVQLSGKSSVRLLGNSSSSSVSPPTAVATPTPPPPLVLQSATDSN